MVGPPPRVTACGVAAWLAVAAAPVPAQEFRVVAQCRDGLPHGAYELRSRGDQLRVSGAFNRGKRTSSFLFWTSAGVRVAHIPFEEDLISGTLSLWYADAPPGREAQQKLEAVFVAGRRSGTTRSWYPNGKARSVLRYERDDLAEARAWSAAGAPLPADAARALAEQDRVEDERYYASLAALVTTHLPNCGANAPGTQRARSDVPG
jgi:hypothetical protein